jgi:hypothetical protein
MVCHKETDQTGSVLCPMTSSDTGSVEPLGYIVTESVVEIIYNRSPFSLITQIAVILHRMRI